MRCFTNRIMLLHAIVVVAFTALNAHAITYTYDALNRLTEVAYDNGDSINYVYDAAGNISEVAKIGHLVVGDKPEVTTFPPDQLSSQGALLHGSVNANDNMTDVIFEYGPTTAYGNFIEASPAFTDGTSETHVSALLLGLNASTIYHFRIKATSNLGTSYGEDKTFVTSSNTGVYNQDINGDGVVDLADPICGLKILVGLNIPVNEEFTPVLNGKVSLFDATSMLSKVAGSEQTNPGNTLLELTAAWLNGKTFYDVHYEDDDSKWVMNVVAFTESGGYEYRVTQPEDLSHFSYQISPEGIIVADFENEDESNYIGAFSMTEERLSICWSSSIEEVKSHSGESEYFYFNKDKAEEFLTARNSTLPDINSFVSGKVVFLDANDNVIPVPGDAFVGISPSIYQNDADGWNRLICKVDSNGNFGHDCYLTHNPEGMRDAFSNGNETFQVVVFKNHLEPEEYSWNCGEDTYKYVGSSVPHGSLGNTIYVREYNYSDHSQDQCGN